MDSLKERFRAVRKSLGLTMDEFGKAIGLSNSGISAIESGQRKVSDKHIKLLCAAYPSVSERWLRTGEGEMYVRAKTGIVDQVANAYGLDTAGRVLLETVLELPDEYAQMLLDVARRLAEKAEAVSQAGSDADFDVDAETELYRQALLREKKATEESSASNGTGGGNLA